MIVKVDLYCILFKERNLYFVQLGMSLTGGVMSRKGMKATEDGKAVELLKDAGAIPLLVSNTSELCSSVHTNNNLFGATKNPYDRRKTPAGSSGGEVMMKV